MYQPIVRLFSCDFRVISIRHLPAALPIKRWLSLLNHVTYAHNSGIRETYVLEICPFHTLFSINGLLFLHICKWRMTGSRVCLMVSFPCLHWWIDTSTLLQMESGSEPYMLHGFSTLSPLMDCYFYTSANGEWQVVVCDLCFFFIISINGLIFIHFCKWRFWDICIQKGACSLHSRLSLFWYPAISQFCDSIIRIAYHTAIYKYGYTIIHGCDGDGSSHPVTWP